MRVRIESLIVVNDKLTKSLRKKLNNRKRRARNEEKGAEASIIEEDESQLSMITSAKEESLRKSAHSPEQRQIQQLKVQVNDILRQSQKD